MIFLVASNVVEKNLDTSDIPAQRADNVAGAILAEVHHLVHHADHGCRALPSWNLCWLPLPTPLALLSHLLVRYQVRSLRWVWFESILPWQCDFYLALQALSVRHLVGARADRSWQEAPVRALLHRAGHLCAGCSDSRQASLAS